MDNVIKSPEDMVNLIKRSINVSNKQGYTRILSDAEQQDQRFDQRNRFNRQHQQYYNRRGKQ